MHEELFNSKPNGQGLSQTCTCKSVNWSSIALDSIWGISAAFLCGTLILSTLSRISSFLCLEKMLYLRFEHVPLNVCVSCNGFICGGILKLTEVNLACTINGTVPNLCPTATAGI